jgi:hypothetical protein
VDLHVLWGLALTIGVLAVLGVWFVACGRADRARRARPFAKRTLVYAGAGLVVGIALLTSDVAAAPPQGRLGLVALTACCALLVYAAVSALVACDDDALIVVNLTGRGLLLTDPDLAPFYTLPAPQPQPATELPPLRPRTYYVVSAELGRIGEAAGRCDLFTVDQRTTTDPGDAGPLLVRRLLRAVPRTASSLDETDVIA